MHWLHQELRRSTGSAPDTAQRAQGHSVSTSTNPRRRTEKTNNVFKHGLPQHFTLEEERTISDHLFPTGQTAAHFHLSAPRCPKLDATANKTPRPSATNKRTLPSLVSTALRNGQDFMQRVSRISMQRRGHKLTRAKQTTCVIELDSDWRSARFSSMTCPIWATCAGNVLPG